MDDDNKLWRVELTGVRKDKLAERVGFEPTEPRGSTVFKTAAFDHSATSPGKIELLSRHVATIQRVHVESGESPRYENRPGFRLRDNAKASSRGSLF